MGKFALFAFTGEATCFIHVLLNGLDLKAKGQEAKIVIEGAACRLIPVHGKRVGEYAEWGGLLGRAPIMPLPRLSSQVFALRGGHIPAPIRSLTN